MFWHYQNVTSCGDQTVVHYMFCLTSLAYSLVSVPSLSGAYPLAIVKCATVHLYQYLFEYYFQFLLVLSQLASAVNLTQPSVPWEEGPSTEELPRSD